MHVITGRPLGRLPVLLPAIAIFGVVLMQSWPRWRWPYQEWIRTSQEFHEQLLLAAPIAAAAATYYAGRYVPPARIFSQPWAPRSGTPVVARHLRTLSVSYVGAFLLGLLPLAALTIARADADSPYLLIMLTGVAGLLAFIAVGYAVGVLSGTAWLSPVTLVVSFVVLQSVHIENALAAVTPVTHAAAGLGSTEPVPLVLYRLVLYAFLCFAAVSIASRALRRRQRWKIPSIATLGVLVVAAVGVVTPVLLKPVLVVTQADQPRMCDNVSGVAVCVHEGHGSQLSVVRNAVERVLFAAGGPPATLRQVSDRALATPADDGNAVDTSWINLYPSSSSGDYAAQSLASHLSGFPNCPLDDTGSVGIADQLSLALLESAGFPQDYGGPDTALGQLSPDRLRSWISANSAAIARCAVPPERLP
jgi:hypothetical protein